LVKAPVGGESNSKRRQGSAESLLVTERKSQEAYILDWVEYSGGSSTGSRFREKNFPFEKKERTGKAVGG